MIFYSFDIIVTIYPHYFNFFFYNENNKFGIANGGDFGFNLSDNFRSPEVTGIYTIKFDIIEFNFSE